MSPTKKVPYLKASRKWLLESASHYISLALGSGGYLNGCSSPVRIPQDRCHIHGGRNIRGLGDKHGGI
ncbi:UNVERIFIED_CONTAM: hypothetical protein Sradi_4194600 [Sesamum radiatum]|uniref:Uncharacterized protein n=1 Tax=Sesamum radiatum TaxID=300843 RepID=A0AAW2P6C1_SESRA